MKFHWVLDTLSNLKEISIKKKRGHLPLFFYTKKQKITLQQHDNMLDWLQ